MYAIIEAGGKQYRVEEGDFIYVEKLDAEENSEVVFDKVVAVSTEAGFKAGTPVVDGAVVKVDNLSYRNDLGSTSKFPKCLVYCVGAHTTISLTKFTSSISKPSSNPSIGVPNSTSACPAYN